jgi:hypothetical protein
MARSAVETEDASCCGEGTGASLALRNTVAIYVPVLVNFKRCTCLMFRFDSDDAGTVSVPVPGTDTTLLNDFGATRTLRQVCVDGMNIAPTSYVDPKACTRDMDDPLSMLLDVDETPRCTLTARRHGIADGEEGAVLQEEGVSVTISTRGMVRDSGFAVVYPGRQWDPLVAEHTIVFTDGTLALPPPAAIGTIVAYTAYDGSRALDGALQRYFPRTLHPAEHVTMEPDAVSSVYSVNMFTLFSVFSSSDGAG